MIKRLTYPRYIVKCRIQDFDRTSFSDPALEYHPSPQRKVLDWVREDCSPVLIRGIPGQSTSVFERLCSSIRHIRVVLLRDEVSKTI